MLLTEQTSAIIEDPIDESAFVREEHPGRPVCAVPVVSVEGLATGDHVILETSLEPYRPCYQSGLVVEIDVRRGRVLLIRNKKEGVSKEWVLFQSFHKVNIVQYTLCQYAEEEAIGRAEHRVKWEESLYHPLFNNSHHLVTWAKTGREYPLTEIIKDFEYTGKHAQYRCSWYMYSIVVQNVLWEICMAEGELTLISPENDSPRSMVCT